jgi:signal transduction histidine kinase
MRLGIKGKQVLGVTSIVGAVVVVLSSLHLARLASVSLEESRARARLLAEAVFHRARDVVVEGADPQQALRADPGLRSILESSLYSDNVTFAAIVDVEGVAVAHADRDLENRVLPAGGDLNAVLERSALSQLAAIYSGQGRNLEWRLPLTLGGGEFGSIRIGISTLLIRDELEESLRPAVVTAVAALAISVLAATLLSQLLLRPIHVIRSGLTRLGRGEFGVRLDLGQHDEFGELGAFFNAASAQISADRSQMAGQVAHLESAVQQIEDAVGLVSPAGTVLFANASMRALLPKAAAGVGIDELAEAGHVCRQLAQETLRTMKPQGPVSAAFPEAGERLLMTYPVSDSNGGLVGAVLVARNLEYLSQVQSTVRYSRKLAALGRLSAGVAHEVKNPLNAMMIHLELLRQQCAGGTVPGYSASGGRGPAAAAAEAPVSVDAAAALQHVDVIAGEIRRLDEVVQGFLKFTRPEDLTLQPVQLPALFADIAAIVGPEAERAGVALVIDGEDAPDVNGDPAMLRQVFLNLALNACQAMPAGGTLRIHAQEVRGRHVEITVADTGIGIEPDHLRRIFDLYFTTKQKGSGIGLSMAYRAVQMHDGEIDVESTPGAGTTFRVLLHKA